MHPERLIEHSGQQRLKVFRGLQPQHQDAPFEVGVQVCAARAAGGNPHCLARGFLRDQGGVEGGA